MQTLTDEPHSEPAEELTVEQLTQIEDQFRTWSFGIYYKRAFREEPDLLKRFVKALLASARPIGDRQMMIDWYLGRRASRRAKALKTGSHA